MIKTITLTMKRKNAMIIYQVRWSHIYDLLGKKANKSSSQLITPV